MQNYTYTYASRPPAPPRRRGCVWQGFIVALAAFACLLLSCGASVLAYIVLPLPPVNVLVLGLDTRDGEGFTTRTDSIMLLGVNPSRLDAALVSFPRDLFINVPGYGAQRINTINVLGEMEGRGQGPELVRRSIGLSFGVQPTHYVRLDFRAFERLVDAVGGVTIDVERLIVDTAYPTENFGTTTVRFEPGRQHMDGARALIYSRTRHSDDDYRRAARQQQVVNAFARRLVNPIYWPAVTLVLVDAIDTDLGPLDIFTLAPGLLLNIGSLDQLVIDRDFIRPGEGGAVPDYDRLIPWMQARFR